MASELQELKVLLQVRDREFARAMDRNTKRIQNFSNKSNRSLSRTTRSFNKLGLAMRGLIPALGAAMLVGKVRRVTAELDEIGKTADNVGLSTDALQELRVVAESSGVSFQEFTKAFQKFTVGVGEATDGTGTAKDALDKLGVSIYTASGQVKDSEQIFNEVSDGLKGFANDSERAGIAADLFGQRVGVKMLNLLRNGSQGMADMRAEARKLGVVIDEDLIRKAETTQTQLDLLARILNAQVSTALINIAPLLVDVGQALASMVSNIGAAYSAIQSVIDFGAGMDEGRARRMSGRIFNMKAQLLDLRAMRTEMEQNPPDFGAAGAGNSYAGNPVYEQWRSDLSDVNSQVNELEASLGALQATASTPADNSAFDQMISQTTERIALMQEEAELQGLSADELARKRAELDATRLYEELFAAAQASGNVVTEEERATIEQVVEALKAEQLALADNTASQGGNSGGRSEVTASAEEQAAALQRVADAVRAEMDARAAGNEALGRSFGEAIKQADTFREALDNVLKLAVKLAATAFLQGMFGVAPSGQSGIAAAISGAGAGLMGRASGGTVSAGTPYMVGENGPEPFIPAQSGRILSVQQAKSAMGGGGGGTSITMNLNVSTGVQSTVRAEMAAMLPQIESVAKRAVIDANQRGGAFRHAITGG